MPDEPQPPQPAEASPIKPVRRRSLWRRIRPLATIAMAVLTFVYTVKEVVHTVHELPEQPQSSFAAGFKSGIDNQLRQLSSVDPMRLGGVFEGDDGGRCGVAQLSQLASGQLRSRGLVGCAHAWLR